ncbi:MAG: FtsX-like permease family protein [Albidovulum sp.]|nr:FtsX-like permease family protein [Albidovulum sp.]MDE0531875.1 FtsX-like permease family protein [Albidovulum sp.]
MSITLRLAWRNLWRQPRRTWLTAGAMVFSNVLLIFLIALQLGTYQAMIDNTLSAFSGHLQVQQAGYKEKQRIRQVVPRIRDVAEDLRSGLGLNSIAARGEAFTLASSESRTYGVLIIGVEPEFEPRASRIPSLVSEGRFLDNPDAPEIVVGDILALNLKAQIGDELTILGSARDGSFAAAVVNIVGIFDSGVDELDRSLAQMPLEFFQETFAMEGAGHAVVINAPSLFEVEAVAEKAKSLLPGGQNLVVHDWNDLQPGLRQAIQADLIGSWFMYGILVILVMFSVLNTQLMSVLERTREFGIVMSLGLSSGRLGRLVLLETVLIGLIGLTLGVALGGIATSWFEAHGFTYPGMEEMASQFNIPDRFYPDLNAISLFAGPTVVFVGSVLAAMYPMARLHWLQPVQAMRSA